MPFLSTQAPKIAMAFDAILQRFMDYSPITVMVRALLERVLTTERLNACFEKAAKQQYTRDLLFSSVFDWMSLVVLKTFPSINAAYKSKKSDVDVSIASVYNKLNGMETQVSSALVHDLSQELGILVTEMQAPCAPLLPGYRVKMLGPVRKRNPRESVDFEADNGRTPCVG